MKYILSVLLLFSFIGLGISQNDTCKIDYFKLSNGHTQYVSIHPWFDALSDNSPIIETGIGPELFMFKNKKGTRAIIIGAEVTIRLFKYNSIPVLPPSYKPYICIVQYLNNSNWFISGELKHHSNGSDVDFYKNDGNVNIRYGSFETNFIKISSGFTQVTEKIGELHRLDFGYRRDISIKNTLFQFPDKLVKSYGRNRIYLNYEYRSKEYIGKHNEKPKHWQYIARIEQKYILGDLSNYQNEYNNLSYRYSIMARFSIKHSLLGQFEPFMQFYHGRDYYNIHFVERLNSIMIGINLDI